MGWQPNTITIKIPKIISEGRYSDFIGDSQVDYPKGDEITVKCFFHRITTDALREKYGVDDSIDMVIHVSPIDLKAITGDYSLSERIMSAKSVPVVFREKEFIPKQIKEIEPIDIGSEKTHIAIEFQLQEEK